VRTRRSSTGVGFSIGFLSRLNQVMFWTLSAADGKIVKPFCVR
jgi:hypothetical protein